MNKIPEPFRNLEEYEEHIRKQALKEFRSKGGKTSAEVQKKKFEDYSAEMSRRGKKGGRPPVNKD